MVDKVATAFRLMTFTHLPSICGQACISRNGAFARFDGLAVAPETGSPDGSTAVVVLSAEVHPPIVNFLIPDGIRIEATSTARSRLVR